MIQYSPLMFELQFLNSSQEGLRRYQKISKPGNWDIVLELSIKTNKCQNGFDLFELQAQTHFFKVNRFELFDGSSDDRIHVFSSDMQTYNAAINSIDANLYLANLEWNRQYFSEATSEQTLLVEKREATKKNALDMIEGVVKSISKKDPSRLMKSDFTFFTFGNDNSWHAYYPTIETLKQHHMNKCSEEQDVNYLEFLDSDILKNLRNVWDCEKTTIPGK